MTKPISSRGLPTLYTAAAIPCLGTVCGGGVVCGSLVLLGVLFVAAAVIRNISVGKTAAAAGGSCCCCGGS